LARGESQLKTWGVEAWKRVTAGGSEGVKTLEASAFLSVFATDFDYCRGCEILDPTTRTGGGIKTFLSIIHAKG
jgi:hypothetical protein